MAYVRLIAPFRHLGVRVINGLQNGVDIEELIDQGDIVILQREFPVRLDMYLRIMESAQRKGKPVLLEIDDLLFFLPEDHPDRRNHYYAPALLPMLQALMEVDAVSVPTPAMRDLLVDYNENIFVVPNYLDDAIWSFKSPSSLARSSSSVTIGYMGTNSHQPDLEYVVPVLVRLLQRYAHRLCLRFWGVRPPKELLQFPQVEYIPCDYRSYEEFALFFQTQEADIFIAPLVDNVFNRCKSPLKFFEYTALGAPGVFSRIEPYVSVIQHGKNGLLAYSLDEWEKCLIDLIEDSKMRNRLATDAQRTVRELWLLSQNAFRWRDVLQNVLALGKRRKTKHHFFNMISSINTQLFEAIQALRDQIETQQNQIEAQQQTIQALNEEILTYVLSRSWRWTRPFRIIHRKVALVRKNLCGAN